MLKKKEPPILCSSFVGGIHLPRTHITYLHSTWKFVYIHRSWCVCLPLYYWNKLDIVYYLKCVYSTMANFIYLQTVPFDMFRAFLIQSFIGYNDLHTIKITGQNMSLNPGTTITTFKLYREIIRRTILLILFGIIINKWVYVPKLCGVCCWVKFSEHIFAHSFAFICLNFIRCVLNACHTNTHTPQFIAKIVALSQHFILHEIDLFAFHLK